MHIGVPPIIKVPLILYPGRELADFPMVGLDGTCTSIRGRHLQAGQKFGLLRCKLICGDEARFFERRQFLDFADRIAA